MDRRSPSTIDNRERKIGASRSRSHKDGSSDKDGHQGHGFAKANHWFLREKVKNTLRRAGDQRRASTGRRRNACKGTLLNSEYHSLVKGFQHSLGFQIRIRVRGKSSIKAGRRP